MRVVIQRVKSASIMVEGAVVAEISANILCLVGLCETDTAEDVRWAVPRILGAKLWDNEDGRTWRKSVTNLNLDVLLVSQFTLYGTLNKKHQPDFRRAMTPVSAKDLFELLVTTASEAHHKGTGRVESGIFGAMMDVALVNDGPVTLVVDTPHVPGRTEIQVTDPLSASVSATEDLKAPAVNC